MTYLWSFFFVVEVSILFMRLFEIFSCNTARILKLVAQIDDVLVRCSVHRQVFPRRPKVPSKYP